MVLNKAHFIEKLDSIFNKRTLKSIPVEKQIKQHGKENFRIMLVPSSLGQIDNTQSASKIFFIAI
jgi:hypothetical protein